MLFQIQKFGMVPIFLFMAVTQLFSQESNTYVVGSVTDANQQPLHNVHVIIKETGLGTYTDADGAYTILAKPRDILSFSYVGMQDVEARVKKSPSVINVEMQAISIELEHLEIKARRKFKTQQDLLEEYPINKNLIKTSWGIMDKESSSLRMRIIDGEDLIPVGTNIFYSIQNHYPQMQVDINGRVYFRKISYSSDPPVIFDVDGMVFVSPPTHFSVNDIDRVAILERNAGMFKYGPQGAGGVIVINTKAQTWMDDPGTNQQYDNRTLVDSLKREVSRLEAYRPYEPSPIGKIQEAKTENQALALYAKEKKKHRNNPYYFLEVYDYFSSHWGNKEQSNEVFQQIIEGFKNDASVLKALAYLQQEQHGHYESTLSLFLKILARQYGNAQAHRDVANAHAEVGDFEKAMRAYTGYANDVCRLPHTPFDALGDDLLITTEMMNILERNKAFLGDKYTIIRSTENSDTLTRLVFEWNNPAAEFELHLMTPDGYYDTWGNVSPNSEAVPGYYSKQFFIDKENKRSWQINIDYKGNRSEMPTYLKVSVYHDYGLTNQTNEIKVYKLSEHHEKIQLLVGNKTN